MLCQVNNLQRDCVFILRYCLWWGRAPQILRSHYYIAVDQQCFLKLFSQNLLLRTDCEKLKTAVYFSLYVTMNHFCKVLHSLHVLSSAFWHHLLTKCGTSPTQTHYYAHPVALHFSVNNIYKQWWLFNLAIKILSCSSSFHSNVPLITYFHNNRIIFWEIKCSREP